MNKIIIGLVIVIILGIGGFFLFKGLPEGINIGKDQSAQVNTATEGVPSVVEENPSETVVGKSVEGRDITAYHYGTGNTELLFIGGIHGGYSWNTALVAYELTDYLEANPTLVPANVKVTVIPVLNPDGLNKVVGVPGRFALADAPKVLAETVVGRFNAHTVDLNRNFDCDWQTNGKWQEKTVSGGTSVFSEPESQAVKNYIETHKPSAVVVWYSAAGGVYASNCHNGIPAETRAIMKVYSDASGYPAYDNFDFYNTTGSMANWLAKNNIPAISVLLSNHTSTEWTKNQKGVEAVLKHYAN